MEYKMKCNVCGKIFCYTDEDLTNNAKNAGMGAIAAIGGLASALGGGTIFHTHHLQGQADRYSDKIVDFGQCPNCHSRDLSAYDGEEIHPDPAERSLPAVKSINPSASTESLLKRAFLFLEDGEWASADLYCEACLDRDPELAAAYLGKMMAQLRVQTLEQLQDQEEPFDSDPNYRKIVRFGDGELKDTLAGYITCINTRRENARKDQILAEAKAKMYGRDISNYVKIAALLESVSGWKDADEQRAVCLNKIAELKAREEADRLERERREERLRKLEEANAKAAKIRAKKNKKLAIIFAPIVIVAVVAAVLLGNALREKREEAARMEAYDNAVALMEAGEYDAAVAAFKALDDYGSATQALYRKAAAFLEEGDYTAALEEFGKIENYQDSREQMDLATYMLALQKAAEGDYENACRDLYALGDFSDSREQMDKVAEQWYQQVAAQFDDWDDGVVWAYNGDFQVIVEVTGGYEKAKKAHDYFGFGSGQKDGLYYRVKMACAEGDILTVKTLLEESAPLDLKPVRTLYDAVMKFAPYCGVFVYGEGDDTVLLDLNGEPEERTYPRVKITMDWDKNILTGYELWLKSDDFPNSGGYRYGNYHAQWDGFYRTIGIDCDYLARLDDQGNLIFQKYAEGEMDKPLAEAIYVPQEAE